MTEETLYQQIKQRWLPFRLSKWTVETTIENGIVAPAAIVDRSKKNQTQHIVHKEYGLKYGASEFTKERLEQRARAIAAAPEDTQILLRAIEYLARDEKHIEFALQHARKRILVEQGELKDDTIVRDYRS